MRATVAGPDIALWLRRWATKLPAAAVAEMKKLVEVE